MKNKTVFLGGTCNNSLWRDDLQKLLSIGYYNPIVPDWTEECYQEELRQRDICDFCLYCITPEMTGVYSIAEVVDDSNKRPNKTIFVYLDYSPVGAFSTHQLKSLKATGKMVESNGGKVFSALEDVAYYLNNA